MQKLLLNEAEAIEFLGGPKRTKLIQLRDAGEIPSVKIGALRRYPVDGLEHYVDRLRAEPHDE
jgi:hypothetical protein